MSSFLTVFVSRKLYHKSEEHSTIFLGRVFFFLFKRAVALSFNATAPFRMFRQKFYVTHHTLRRIQQWRRLKLQQAESIDIVCSVQ